MSLALHQRPGCQWWRYTLSDRSFPANDITCYMYSPEPPYGPNVVHYEPVTLPPRAWLETEAARASGEVRAAQDYHALVLRELEYAS